jgi:DNA repair protein RadC
VLSASEAQLVRTCGPNNEVGRMIAAARMLVEASLRERVLRSKVTTDDPALLEYLILKLRGCAFEELHAIFLDADGCYLSEELISRGDIQSVESRTAPIFRCALDLDAASVILVHNHPSKNPEPSREDIVATAQLVRAAKIMGLGIVDHLIVAGNITTSFRKRGLL